MMILGLRRNEVTWKRSKLQRIESIGQKKTILDALPYTMHVTLALREML
jgi:hypothetical protein